MRKIFTLDQKIEALALSDKIGPKAAAIALNININTLKSWRYLRNEILKDDYVKEYNVSYSEQIEVKSDADIIDKLYQNQFSATNILIEEIEKLQACNRMLEIEKRVYAERASLIDRLTLIEDTFLIRELAKILNEKGLEVTVRALFERLKEDEFLIKNQFADANTPTSKSIDLEIMRYKIDLVDDETGTKIVRTARITGKGIVYFLNFYTTFKKCACCGIYEFNWDMIKTNNGNYCKKCVSKLI